MGHATELTESAFEQTVGTGVALVDFWAEWCGPCKMIAPTIEQLAQEYSGRANITKVNVDNEMGLAQKFNVASIPTLIVLKDGKEATRFVGVTSKTELAKALDQAGA
jgi:thioredoxin 1